jgi:hypothetical protein
MKALITVIAIAFAAGAAVPAASASWAVPYAAYPYDQGQKGRGGGQRGQPSRDYRPDRGFDRGERRERLNEDERRALHRDLDKAQRELYQRRQK